MSHGGARKGAGRPKGEPSRPIRLPESWIEPVLRYIKNQAYQLPLYGAKVPAGQPHAADDYVEEMIDLNALLIHHPGDTFLVRASGESMILAGIHDNDILVVDRRREVKTGNIVIAALDSQLTVKRLHKTKEGQIELHPENPVYPVIPVPNESAFHIWGVVTQVIHSLIV